MSFDPNQFTNLAQGSNSNLSRFKKSSIDPLIKKLTALGRSVGPGRTSEILPLWVNVPFDKQQKYSQAADYLKRFVPALPDAIPVKPKMEFTEFKADRDGIPGDPTLAIRLFHIHYLTWESSNGHLQSLKDVGTRERITHRSSPSARPFRASVTAGIPMQFTQGEGKFGANSGKNRDDHSIGNPCLILEYPLQPGSVIADQVYEYSTDGGQTFSEIEGSRYTIEKGVRRASNGMVFYFRKKSSSIGKRFHFEVEYPIGPMKTYPSARIKVRPSSFLPTAQITTFGKLIAPGNKA